MLAHSFRVMPAHAPTIDLAFPARGSARLTRLEFSKWSGGRIVCISFAPGEKKKVSEILSGRLDPKFFR